MNNTQSVEPLTKADAEYEVAIGDLLREMEQLRVDMEERQQRIEQMQADNKLLLAQLAQFQVG